MRNCVVPCLFFTLCLLFTAAAKAENCLLIASPPKYVHAAAEMFPDMKKLFQKAGICMKHVQMPLRRIEKEMKKGRLDGEFIRVEAYIRLMDKHVIPVPTPISHIRGVILTKRSSGFQPETLKDVKNMSVGYVKGIKWHESVASQLKQAAPSKKYGKLVHMLMAERVDGILIERSSVRHLIKNGYIRKNDVHISQDILSTSAHLLLHKKNAAFVAQLDKAAQFVLAQGAFARLRAQRERKPQNHQVLF